MDISAKAQMENEERVAEEYLSSLSDLNCNSKPLINMLTMLAEENIEYAPVIVKVVEQHIAKVPPDFKLPILYLIDSIVKNVKSTYVQLFSQCIINIFCGVFEKVNEKTRERMYALRQTWNEVFSGQKLYALDVKVKCLDNNWPITAKQPSIHVNPNFLKTVSASQAIPADMGEILHHKTRELLELKKRKLELELEATKKHLEEQEKQLSKATDNVIPAVEAFVAANALKTGIHPQTIQPQLVPGMVTSGFMAPQHPGHVGPVGGSSAAVNNIRPTLYHNVRNYRPPMHHVAPDIVNAAQQGFAGAVGSGVNKPKVHPVNSALLNTMRHRDPRLARQQQQQQQQQIPDVQVQSGRSGQVHGVQSESKTSETAKSDAASKSNRNLNSGAGSSFATVHKSPTRRSSSSNRSSGRSNKSSSRDKDKDRKRSESKSSTTSSSSTGSSASNNERKKLSSSAIHNHNDKQQSSKCDKDSFEIAPLSAAVKRKSSPAASPAKSKESKRPSNKARTFSRVKTRSRSPSPDIDVFKDIDLRRASSSSATSSISPDKRPKHSDSEQESSKGDRDKSTSTVNSKDLDKIGIGIGGKSIGATTITNVLDLDSKAQASHRDYGEEVGAQVSTGGRYTDIVNDNDGNKRPSVSNKEEEPLPKKSKSAKLDALFGSEDVDLRQVMSAHLLSTQKGSNGDLNAVSASSTAPPPPPPPIITSEVISTSSQRNDSWDNLKADTVKSSTKKSSTLEDVRAKLAKTAKLNKFSKFEKSNKEISQRLKLAELNMNEDTQEANDEKIRTIITQAQELLEANSINQEQYKNLVHTVMSINETNKLKEAKRRESLKAVKQKTILVSDEDSNDAERMAAREAVLRKRIPKLSKVQIDAASDDDPKVLNSPRHDNCNANDSPRYEEKNDLGNDVFTKVKSNRDKRSSKSSKWGERVNESSSGGGQHRQWLSGPQNKRGIGFRSSVPHPPLPPMPNPNLRLPWQMGMVGPPHFSNTPMQLLRSNILPPNPPQSTSSLVAKPCNSIDNPQEDLVRTITIDGAAKEIRIYDQVAIVFMDLDQPREIGFQNGQRSIYIDNHDPIILHFNDDYKPVTIDGETLRLRFGFPSRELYIDDHWYEIYFGGPAVSVPIRNKIHILKAEGPPPQVNIGPLRRDLVVGKINMIVDAHIIIPLFLDARIQTFCLGEKEHSIQFADNLLTVLIDGTPTKVEYGGLPKSMTLGGVKYFIRFGALPQGVEAGKVEIKDMIYVETQPLKVGAAADTNDRDLPKALPLESQDESQSRTSVPVSAAAVAATTTTTTESAGTASVPLATAALSNINIDELFQKLVSSGILGGTGTMLTGNKPESGATEKSSETPQESIRPIDLSKPESVKTRQAGIIAMLFSGMQCSSCGVRFPPEQTIKYSQHLDWHFRQNRRERDSSRKAHSRKWYYELNDWVQYEEIEDLEDREKNFFETQQNDLEAIDETSNQRSTNSPVPSCAAGPDDVDRVCDMCQEKFEQFYNEDLEEWHLRSALRVDDKIYHPLCYEDYKASLNPPKSSNDEEENPSKDNSLVSVGDDNAVDIDLKVEEDKANDDKMSQTINCDNDGDDDDDVIVLPNDEPLVTEIDDDDDDDDDANDNNDANDNEEEYVPTNVTGGDVADTNDTEIGDTSRAVMNATTESDVEIEEPQIPFTDLDTYVEKELPEGDDASQMSFLNVKIKEEPKDDEDEDGGFEDVGTVLIAPDEISIHSSEETQTQTIDSASAMSPRTECPAFGTSSGRNEESATTESIVHDLNSSMDGNLETNDKHNLSSIGPAPTVPLASLVNKIKINITKNNVSTSSNSSSTASATSSNTATTSTTHNPILNSNEQTGTGVREVGQSAVCNPIPTISTIPVLCGGGTTISTLSNTSTDAANNVSTISVIGSYGGSSSSSGGRFHSHASPIGPSLRLTTPPPQPQPQPQAQPQPQPQPIEETITYELKPALQKVTLKKNKKIVCGSETSGLCSIM